MTKKPVKKFVKPPKKVVQKKIVRKIKPPLPIKPFPTKRKKAGVKFKVEPERSAYAKARAPSEQDIEKLLRKGMSRGFITENEILFTFSDLEDYLPLYEDLLDRLEEKGIHLIEMKEGILGQESDRDTVF